MLWKHLGEKLRDVRLRRGWSQARAAEEIGIDTGQIARMETGVASPRLTTLVAVCLAYRVALRTLLPAEFPLGTGARNQRHRRAAR